MKKLTLNLLTLSISVFLVIGFIVAISPKSTQTYLAAAVDKQQLLETIQSPKIILVGGSNLAFSVDSEKIENLTGMPVINMGLHAAIGLRYMVNEVIPYVKAGDIVLIVPEYEHFIKPEDLDGRPAELGTMIKLCPECIVGISTPVQISNIAIGILQKSEGDLWRVIITSESDSVYSRKGFNRFGDFVGHLNQPVPGLTTKDRVVPFSVPINNATIQFLNFTQEKIEKKNARVFLMFPAIPDKDFKSAENDFIAFQDLLKANLNIPLLGSPQDFIFPEGYFFDTIYHMNNIGREQRTDQMIKLILPILDKK